MKNQFVYTVKFQVPNPEIEGEMLEKETKCSFNMNKVIRSMEIPNGNLIIILDDFHEDMVTQPDTVNPKTHRVIHGKKEKVIVQSEIHLSPEDKERFLKITNIEA